MTAERFLQDTDWARHSMCFIDGENLVARAQAHARNLSLDLAEGSHYKRDSFIWTPSGGVFELLKSRRVYHFAGVSGAEDDLNAVREQLWALGHDPQVFKKDSRAQRTKGDGAGYQGPARRVILYSSGRTPTSVCLLSRGLDPWRAITSASTLSQ